jgi:hypothetical protein
LSYPFSSVQGDLVLSVLYTGVTAKQRQAVLQEISGKNAFLSSDKSIGIKENRNLRDESSV